MLLILTMGPAVYTGVCNCAAGLGPLTLTSKITLINGCTAGCAPTTIPMTTTTQLCNNCGPNNVPAIVTLTVPCTACANAAIPTVPVVPAVPAVSVVTATVYAAANGAPCPGISTRVVTAPTGKPNATYTGPLVGMNGAGTVTTNGIMICVFSLFLSFFIVY